MEAKTNKVLPTGAVTKKETPRRYAEAISSKKRFP